MSLFHYIFCWSTMGRIPAGYHRGSSDMQQPKISDSQALMLLDLCIEAEQRCEERMRRAQKSKDYRRASEAVEAMTQYAELKQRLLAEIRSAQPMVTPELREKLLALSRPHEAAGEKGPARDARKPEVSAKQD